MAAKRKAPAAPAVGRRGSRTKSAPARIHRITDAPLSAGTYTATQAFRAVQRHAAVHRTDGLLVAVTGPADDLEAATYAALFSQAPAMRQTLERIEKAIQDGVQVELSDVQVVLDPLRKGAIS